MRTVPHTAVLRAMFARDLTLRSALIGMVMFAMLGICAALAAAQMPPNSAGSSTLLFHFDRTLIAVAGIAAVFRTIQHFSTDADAEWLLQLVAAGASRDAYALSIVASVTAFYGICYIAGAAAFDVARFLQTHSTEAFARTFHALPFVALPLLSASLFGGAVACVAGRGAAARIATALLLAPWIALWLTIAAHGEPMSAASWLRFLDYPVPDLFVDTTLRFAGTQLMYVAAAILVVVLSTQWRIGRPS
jgi:hypothetical protein